MQSHSTATAVAYSYIRLSTPEQPKRDSLRRQTELRVAWLARNDVGLDTSLTLHDEGVSGFKGKHRDKLSLIPNATKAVRQIFRLAASGYGMPSIIKKLNADKVPAI